MALSTPAVLTTYIQTTGNDTEWTTAAFTPTANSLMIVVVATLDGSTISPVYNFSIASTHTGQGAFTQREVSGPVNNNSRTVSCSIHTSQTGATPGSGTVTVTLSGTAAQADRVVTYVLEITGHDTTTPVGVTGDNNGTDATLEVTMSGTPTSTSTVIAAVGAADDTTINDIGVGTGFTELDEDNSGGSTATVTCNVMYDATSADSSADWSNLPAVNSCGVAIEILVAASGAVNITPAEATQAQASDAVTIRAISPIVPAEATQAQLSDTAIIAAAGATEIAPAEALQSQVSDAAAIVSINPITPAEATQAQASDAASISVLRSFVDGNGGDVNTAVDVNLHSTAHTYNGGVHNAVQFNDNNYALMEFNLSSIPASSTIVSAKLFLGLYEATIGSGNIYAVLAANDGWIEGTGDLELALEDEPCWDAKQADGAGGVKTAWAGGSNGCGVVGTDISASTIGTFTVNDADPSVIEVDLDSNTVAGWFGASNTNYGILIKPTATNPYHIALAEYTDTAYRPRLEILYVSALDSIIPADSTQTQLSDAASIVAITPLAPAEATQTQTSDAATFGQFIPIAPAESTQAQASDVALIAAISPLAPAEATQAQASDAVTITAIYPIAPAEATQSQSSDAAVITGAGTYAITPAEALQDQSSDAVTITAIYPITPAEATQSQTSDAAGITYYAPEAGITPAEATQAQLSDPVTLAVVHVVTVADATQSQISDLAVLSSPVTAYPPGNRRLLEPDERTTGAMAVRASSVFGVRQTLEVDD